MNLLFLQADGMGNGRVMGDVSGCSLLRDAVTMPKSFRWAGVVLRGPRYEPCALRLLLPAVRAVRRATSARRWAWRSRRCSRRRRRTSL